MTEYEKIKYMSKEEMAERLEVIYMAGYASGATGDFQSIDFKKYIESEVDDGERKSSNSICETNRRNPRKVR